MLRILTLGGLSIEAPTDRPHGVQSRLQGLGLLARLAVAGERGLSREKLIGCFWPEKEERQALHSLSQALHRLRGELGCDEIVVGTRILRLDPAYLSSDVGDFEAAHRARDAARMVELYAGPFLDGVYFPTSPELDRWVERERQRIASLHAGALRMLAARAAAAGVHDDAVQRWRQLVALDPLDGALVLELVRALVASGDDASALREARVHQELTRTELRREPDGRIEEFLRRHALAIAADPVPVVRGAEPGASDQLSAKAIQCLYRFTPESMAEAVRYAERATVLEPRNARAHATLGWACIAYSQGERSGDLRSRGIRACEAALSIDPGLTDAKVSLAWAAQLDERFEEAEALALCGLREDPDGLAAHTALGWVRLNWGLRTGRWEKCVESVYSLAHALAIHPRDPHAALVLAALYSLDGQHDVAARLSAGTAEVERSSAGEMRTIGAQAMLGQQQLRGGHRDLARETLSGAYAAYRDAPQIYAPYVNALTLVGLGDLARMTGGYDEALHCYQCAQSALDARPALIGAGLLSVRLQLRIAGVFRLLRMRPEEVRHHGIARQLTAARGPSCFNWCWGVSDPELHYDWAVYHAVCGDRDVMVVALARARAAGWREIGLLDVEPAFAFTRDHPALQALVAEARGRPPLPDPVTAGRPAAAAPPSGHAPARARATAAPEG